MNELCEEIFGKRSELLKEMGVRETLVATCQSYRYMSVKEINDAFGRIPGLVTSTVPTEACDLGRALEPPVGQVAAAAPGGPGHGNGSKMVMFCLDWSASMLSRDTAHRFPPLTRFRTCVQCVQRILRDQ